MNNPECDYSFDMLYKAAFGKALPKNIKQSFQNLDQEKINNLVKEWADKAGWNTKLKEGNDGYSYLAFWPN